MSKSADYKSQGALGDDPSLPLKWEAGLDQVIRLKRASQRVERRTKDKSVLLCFDLKVSRPSLLSFACRAQQLWVNTGWFLLIKQMCLHSYLVFGTRAETRTHALMSRIGLPFLLSEQLMSACEEMHYFIQKVLERGVSLLFWNLNEQCRHIQWISEMGCMSACNSRE